MNVTDVLHTNGKLSELGLSMFERDQLVKGREISFVCSKTLAADSCVDTLLGAERLPIVLSRPSGEWWIEK